MVDREKRVEVEVTSAIKEKHEDVCSGGDLPTDSHCGHCMWWQMMLLAWVKMPKYRS